MSRGPHPMVSRTLSSGVMLSFVLLVVGLVESFLRPRSTGLNPEGILAGIFRGEPMATVTAGLLVLMITPLMRVVVLTLEFIRAREIPFAMISIGVLFLLAVTLAISFG